MTPITPGLLLRMRDTVCFTPDEVDVGRAITPELADVMKLLVEARRMENLADAKLREIVDRCATPESS